jgi:putative transposon-encoded protein
LAVKIKIKIKIKILRNNKTIVHERFIQIFGMASTHFSKKLAIPKNN